MIYKSYIVEENFKILKNDFALFYGENLGLIQDFKEEIKKNYSNYKILKYDQDELLKNEEHFYNELKNKSLFDEKKIFFINHVSDKLLNIIENVIEKNITDKIFLFSDPLEKKSKIRNFFEKGSKTDVIPCYQDNSLSIKKIIFKNFNNYPGFNSDIVNYLIDNCNLDRSKLRNEINKIKTYFNKKSLNIEELDKLLNFKENNDFGELKDAAILGDKINTNKLLSSTIIEEEKSVLYLAMINQRLSKINELQNKNENIEKIIDRMRPPIFWKDKPMIINQAKKWNNGKLKKALNETFNFEIKIKSNSLLDKKIIIKKLLINICNLSNAA